MTNNSENKPTVGLLAFQGAYLAHRLVFKTLSAPTSLVRYPSDLETVDALVVPGGETTTMLKLLEPVRFTDLLIERVRGGMPYFGTCAGAVLAARDVTTPPQPSLEMIDITIERNAYGRQVDSFTADFPLQGLNIGDFHGVFIRAPIITRVGSDVKVLAEYGGHPILVKCRNILLATFHPELSGSNAIHKYFLEMLSSQ